MINEMWKKYETDYLDEFDELAAYEDFFVEKYLDLGDVYPPIHFYMACQRTLEFCADRYKINLPVGETLFCLLYLKKRGLVKQYGTSMYLCTLTDEGKEALEWMKEQNRKENENETKSSGLVTEGN